MTDRKDKPEQGKVYALTGRSDQPSIARGDSWKKSLVTKKRKEQDAKKEDVSEGPLQDRRQAQSKKRQAMDALRRKQVQQKQLASRAAKEKEKSDIESRRDFRTAQASKHAQKNWRAEATDIVDAVANQITADFDPRTHKVPRPAGMSKKQFDYKYKPTKVRKPKKDTGMKTPETQAALKYLKGKGPSPYGPGGKYEPKKEEVKIDEGPPSQKFKPLRHKVWSADASIPAGARPKNPGKIKKYKASGALPEEVEIDELTQAEYDSGGLVRKHLDRKQASGTSRDT